jgi:hypothetical protein
MRRPIELGLVFLAIAGSGAACAEQTSDAAPSANAASSANMSAAPSGAGGKVTGAIVRGTVREQIPVSPYVYLRLETPEGEVWAAVAEAPVTVGEPVTVYNAMLMERFESASLARAFERIWFGALEPPANGVHGALSAAPLSTGAAPVADARVGPITPATGSDARTIDALWSGRVQLAGTTVSVRGVVVKVNDGVMGKNWIHLQDGTGDAARGTHDLTVTSAETAAVGDTITVTGVVRLDQDVGAGYTYALLIEDARVVRR